MGPENLETWQSVSLGARYSRICKAGSVRAWGLGVREPGRLLVRGDVQASFGDCRLWASTDDPPAPARVGQL